MNACVSCFNMKLPALMFPKEEEEEKEEQPSKIYFFNLKEKKYFRSNALQTLQDCRCVGSSHGWLVILSQELNPFLLNIVSESILLLPGKETFPHIQSIRELENAEFEVHYKCEKNSISYSLKNLQEWLMVKAVLSDNPSCNPNYSVITMYNLHCKSKLAICRQGDSKWTGLYGELDSYCDIVCRDNLLCALGHGPSVEIWELNGSSSRSQMMVQVPCPRNFTESHKIYPRDLYSSTLYLVFLPDKLFLVVRHIGEFVRYDGEVVYEADTLTDYSSQPLICPYRTVGFDIYNLNFQQKKWLQVESLKDVTLFIGGNHSAALSVKEYPECKANAIYFTDDYWDRMHEDTYYGGHDMGVFNLKDGSIEPVFDREQERFEPSPFWILPN